MENPLFYPLLLLGLLIVIVTLLRHVSQKSRQNAQKQRQRELDLQAAQEVDRKRQMLHVVPKMKRPQSTSRMPLPDSLGTPFVGSVQGNAAKWEAEIHKLGRQIIGQIDSKMAALQAITLDANRTANRLEILVEHLEYIARKQIEWQQQAVQHATGESEETSSTVIPATESATAESIPDAAPLVEVLKEIDDDLKGIHKAIKQSTAFGEQVAPATVLRLAELQVESSSMEPPVNLRNEVEMLANYGLEPKDIAQKLNISIGEVDLMLQVQQNTH